MQRIVLFALVLTVGIPAALPATEFVMAPLWTAGGTGSSVGEFGIPESVAIDSLDRVVVTDKGRMKLHVYASTDGAPLFDVGNLGSALGNLDRPNGIAIDRDGRVLVVEQTNQRVQIFDRAYRSLGSFGAASGPGSFQKPMGIALGPDGRIFVTDEARGDVQVFDAQGRFQFKFTGGPRLDKVESIEVHAPTGEVFVCDEGRSCVNVYDLQGRYIESFGEPGSGPGQFGNDTNAVRLDGRGRIYVNDQGNLRLNVFAPDRTFLASIRCAGRDMESSDGMALSEKHNLLLVADQGNDRVLAWDLGEVQCRLARVELDSPAATVGPLRVSNSGLVLPDAGAIVWADTRLDLEATVIGGSPTRIERGVVHVRSGRDRRGICVTLVETGPATNRLAARVQLAPTSDENSAKLAADPVDRLGIHWAGESAERFLTITEAPAPLLEHLRFDGREPEQRLSSARPRVTWRCNDPLGLRQQTGFELRILAPDRSVAVATGPITTPDCFWDWPAPGLEVARRYEFQLRVATGHSWSEWTRVTIEHNAPPAEVLSFLPASGTVLRDEPVQLEARLRAAADGDALRASFELWLADGSRLNSPPLVAVDDLLHWIPTIALPENGLLHWRIVATDGHEKRLGEWWSLSRNQVEEPPAPPELQSPADGAVVRGTSVTLQWRAAVDPDPGSSASYEVEWSTDPSFANFQILAAGAALSALWSESTADGVLHWRVRVQDATGQWNRSAPRHLRLDRTLTLDLVVIDELHLRSSVLLGARPGAHDAFVTSEDRQATVPLRGPHVTSLLGASELATDWRAPRDPAKGSWTWRLRLQGQPFETLHLEARSLRLPAPWRARFETAEGGRGATLTRPGERMAIRLGADGEAMVLVRVEARSDGESPVLDATNGGGAAPTTAKAVIGVPGVARIGMRLQLAPATAGGVGFEIYDVRGRQVRQARTGADGSWTWDGRDAGGGQLASGIYLLQVRTPHALRRHKLVWASR